MHGIASLLALGAVVSVGPSVARAQEAPDEAAERSAIERALGELSAAYQSLAGLVNQGSGEAAERVQGDIENLGDWEYRIVDLEDDTVETLEAELNLLGNERWEVYWLESTRDGKRFYLKRPSISYLSRVPLSTLLRMLAAGGQ